MTDARDRPGMLFVPRAHVPIEFVMKDALSGEVVAFACSLALLRRGKWWRREHDKICAHAEWLNAPDLEDVFAVRGVQTTMNSRNVYHDLSLCEGQEYKLLTLQKKKMNEASACLVCIQQIFVHRNNHVGWVLASRI